LRKFDLPKMEILSRDILNNFQGYSKQFPGDYKKMRELEEETVEETESGPLPVSKLEVRDLDGRKWGYLLQTSRSSWKLDITLLNH
jgi:hypothetical protein